MRMILPSYYIRFKNQDGDTVEIIASPNRWARFWVFILFGLRWVAIEQIKIETEGGGGGGSK